MEELHPPGKLWQREEGQFSGDINFLEKTLNDNHKANKDNYDFMASVFRNSKFQSPTIKQPVTSPIIAYTKWESKEGQWQSWAHN